MGEWLETGSELTWLPVQHVLGLHPSDVGDGGEDVRAVGRTPLQAVAVVDLTIASLFIDVELQHTQKKSLHFKSFFYPFIFSCQSS